MTELVFSRGRILAGDSRAEAIYVHRGLAYRVAFAILGNREQAEDIAHDALLKALDSDGELTNAAAWVRTIAVRTALNARRRPTMAAIDEDMTGQSSDVAADLAVRETLNRMTPDHRAVLALAVGEGLSYREVSEALGIPEGTVGSRLNAAKEAFRREWNA